MTDKIADTVDRFLKLVKSEDASQNDIEQLIKMLDELALLAHGIRYDSEDIDYPFPPEIHRHSSFHIAERWLDGMRKGGDNHNYFDAVMDFSELIEDMEKIHWCFINTSKSDALFHYQFGFWSHWGSHLRSLQKLIHDWYW